MSPPDWDLRLIGAADVLLVQNIWHSQHTIPTKSKSTGQETVEEQTNREIEGGRSECRSMSVAGLMWRGGQQKSTSGTCSFPVELGSKRESGLKHQNEEEVADVDTVCCAELLDQSLLERETRDKRGMWMGGRTSVRAGQCPALWAVCFGAECDCGSGSCRWESRAVVLGNPLRPLCSVPCRRAPPQLS